MVALTLPKETVRGLRRIHPDLAWAIVTLFEKRSPTVATKEAADVDLVTIGGSRSLIVVNPAVFKRLPGVNIIPLSAGRAFLALEPGRGMADLELAVIDRLEAQSLPAAERAALGALRAQVARWRHARTLRFHTRAIIVVERVSGARLSALAR
jgi:hypothetical protein